MDAAVTARSPDVKVVGLVSIAHGFSHFFQLALPPVFALLKDDFGVSYLELGFMVTLFYVTSGVCQAAAGFVVDRFGARPVLMGGLALFAGAITLVGFAPNYWSMVALYCLAAIGNSVFHPADYSILSASVCKEWIGRAYSMHTLAGNLGWAAAYPTLTILAGSFGWRTAIVIVGLTGLAFALILLMQSAVLRDDTKPKPLQASGAVEEARVLITLPVFMCFLFFVCLSMSLIGVQTFVAPALIALHDTPLFIANSTITAYLIGGSVGIFVGGYIADRTSRHHIVAALGLGAAAALIAVAGIDAVPNALLFIVIAGSGIAVGLTTPSRDMLVRGATPPGSTGKVFGFVYSGLDVGGAITPSIFGWLMDHDAPRVVFAIIAVVLLFGIMTALAARQGGARAAQPAE
jgi:MFS transporter, FSR family, fosmidomycin resistance protein